MSATIERTETVQVRAVITDKKTGLALDPDTQTWSIYEGDTLLKEFTTGDLTKEGDGIYYVYWDVPSGSDNSTLKLVCKVLKGTRTGIGRAFFGVQPS
jgi:hypothetical protein